MSQYKNFSGKRYFSTLIRMSKSGALNRAKSYRQHGLLSRITPDGQGTYTVWTAERGKR